MTATKRYALKGVNDDESECSVCGKVELKRVMWLVELDSDGNPVGDAFHCGTTCGAKLMGYSQSKLRTKVDGYKSAVWCKRDSLRTAKIFELGYWKLFAEIRHLTQQDKMNTPQWKRMREIEAEAKAYADAQEITIEL